MLVFPLLVAASCPLARPGDVIDAGFGHPYPTIAAAVIAAASGDTIRVFPGHHGSFAIHGKSVTILGQGSLDTYDGTVRIQGLQPGQSVVIDGLSFRADSVALGDAAFVAGLNQGSIRLSDCRFFGATLTNESFPGEAARIIHCDDVALESCALFGGSECAVGLSGANLCCAGTLTVEIDQSRVSFHDSSVLGASGFERSSPGGRGVHATDSWLNFQGCSVRGGSGAFASGFDPPGGPGLALLLDGSHANLLATPHNTGSPTLWVGQSNGATLDAWDGGPLDLLAPSEVRDDVGSVSVDLTGDAIDLVFLVNGANGGRRELPGLVGALLIGGAVQRRVVGIGASLSYSLSVPDVAPLTAEGIHLQSVHLRLDSAAPSGRRVFFGPSRVITVLDAAL